MARDIDDLIDYVKSRNYLSDILKQVVINRIEQPPTKDEIETAKDLLASRPVGL